MPNNSSLQLTLVDQSDDANNSTVLIFQRNVVASLGEDIVAWQVIQNLGLGWTHSFTYHPDVSVAVKDSYGNLSRTIQAAPGELFSAYHGPSGDQLKAVGSVPNQTDELWICNDLGQGAIDACVYRSGKVLATKTGVVPGQTATFKFLPSIQIGVVSQWDVAPGQAINSAIISTVQSEIPLSGLTGSATIVMSGGGKGPTATPFTFTLQP